ncbi:unnamed protein product [Camellia sinensis]
MGNDLKPIDRLFEMPDDILSFILSFLSIRDSVKARYSMSKFVTEVDQFLELYNGQKLDSLRICFCLGNEYTGNVDRWIRFAIIMKTEKLDLDFSASPESQLLPQPQEKFEISSIGLTTFEYIGIVKNFSFLDVPWLEKVHIRFMVAYERGTQYMFNGIANDPLRLQTLSLVLTIEEVLPILARITRFNSLEQLELFVLKLHLYIAKTLYGDDDEEVTPQNSGTVEEPKCLGLYLGSNEKILLKNGPYGFYVQLGEDRKGYLPKRASVSQ